MIEKPSHDGPGQPVKALQGDANDGKLQDLQRHVAELERSDQELRRYVRSASHDLQESLNVVLRYLQFVEARYKGRLDSDANEFIASAVREARRMERIITELSAYSGDGM